MAEDNQELPLSPSGGEEKKSAKLDKESKLTLKLSATLIRKLTEKAQVEGVSVQDFASELLAEGLVLRAWEIMEKKGAMRAQGPSPQGGAGFRSNNKPGYRSNGHQHGKRSDSGGQKGVSRQSYKNIMEDSANFLEYVRSQEKKDRY